MGPRPRQRLRPRNAQHHPARAGPAPPRQVRLLQPRGPQSRSPRDLAAHRGDHRRRIARRAGRRASSLPNRRIGRGRRCHRCGRLRGRGRCRGNARRRGTGPAHAARAVEDPRCADGRPARRTRTRRVRSLDVHPGTARRSGRGTHLAWGRDGHAADPGPRRRWSPEFGPHRHQARRRSRHSRHSRRRPSSQARACFRRSRRRRPARRRGPPRRTTPPSPRQPCRPCPSIRSPPTRRRRFRREWSPSSRRRGWVRRHRPWSPNLATTNRPSRLPGRQKRHRLNHRRKGSPPSRRTRRRRRPADAPPAGP